MTLQRWQLEQRARQAGKTLADVAACVVSSNGDTLVVDVDHADYPRQRKPLYSEADLEGYDPNTSEGSPKFGSCCDAAKKKP